MFEFFSNAKQVSKLPLVNSAQLLPRVRHISYLQKLRDAGVPEDQLPHTAPLCGELLETYAFDLPEHFIMATPSMLKQADINTADVARMARENLQRTLPLVKFHRQYGCSIAETGNLMEASLLLVDGIWAALQIDTCGELLVTAPSREHLITSDSAMPHAILVLGAMTDGFFEDTEPSHRLSNQIMVRRDNSWALFGPPPITAS